MSEYILPGRQKGHADISTCHHCLGLLQGQHIRNSKKYLRALPPLNTDYTSLGGEKYLGSRERTELYIMLDANLVEHQFETVNILPLLTTNSQVKNIFFFNCSVPKGAGILIHTDQVWALVQRQWLKEVLPHLWPCRRLKSIFSWFCHWGVRSDPWGTNTKWLKTILSEFVKIILTEKN